MRRLIKATGALVCAFTILIGPSGCASTQQEQVMEPPRLVLQITVDQLRGDLPTRFLERLGEGGFR